VLGALLRSWLEHHAAPMALWRCSHARRCFTCDMKNSSTGSGQVLNWL
jgi:hypothetical protein